MERVAVTGIGLATPLGDTPDQFFDALLRGDSGIALYTASTPDESVAVPAASCPLRAEDHFTRAELSSLDRVSQLSVLAARRAWETAAPAPDGAERDSAGVFWGTGMGGAQTLENSYLDLLARRRGRVHPLTVPNTMNNAAAAHIAMRHELGGAALTYSVACASSAVAIGEAWRRIRSGECALAVAGGGEALLSFGVIRSWQALQVLARGDAETAHRACRPFASDRDGLVLGEGAGALVLENWQRAQARGARILGEIVGYGLSCDHLHLTRPDAQGQLRAMRQALAVAGIAAADLGYVNAHGTATGEGDRAECEALQLLLGAAVDRVGVSSTKSAHGHLMGAAGAVEFIATLMALARRTLPPTAFLEEVDPACALAHVKGAPRRDDSLRYAMSNSFAFGGSNAVLIAAAA